MSPVTTTTSRRGVELLPAVAGIGLRAPHYRQILKDRPALGWLEVHSENFFANGGLPAHFLNLFREHYSLSFHGVGLSLGSSDPLNAAHLDKLARLVDHFQPALISEHLSWSSVGGRYVNDLLPMPYTRESLRTVAARVYQAQEKLQRQILIENISSYLQFEDSVMAEVDFLLELAGRTGCGLLLDVNNVYVSACNHGFDAAAYLRAIPGRLVQEIHLAGHTLHQFDEGEIRIDTHNQRVCPEVWALYDLAIQLYGPKPTLIEWDSDLPALDVLLDEKRHADTLMEENHARVA